MTIDIRIERSRDGFELLPNSDLIFAKHKIKDFMDDVANQLVITAREFAPESSEEDKLGGSARDIPSGSLKAHPVDQTFSEFGVTASVRGEAEGFRSIRGAGGRFVKGKGTGIGHIFYRITTSYPERTPFYAKYVAFGTGPRAGHAPIVSPSGKRMKFYYKGSSWIVRSTQGQEANPYLDYAVDAVNTSYIPIKLEALRARIAATT